MELDRDKLRTAGWLVAAAVVALLAVRALVGGGDDGEAVTVQPAPASKPAPGAAPGSPPGPAAFVQVAGEVRRPGVYRVGPGGRVNDAVQLAGGLTSRADPAGVNLVARVTDGQQVVVPRRGAGGPAAAAPGAAPAGASGAKVSLASATLEQLDAIDGIGPTLAKRIVEYRDAHGGFRSVDELRQVDGIGEKRFESLREAVAP